MYIYTYMYICIHIYIYMQKFKKTSTCCHVVSALHFVLYIFIDPWTLYIYTFMHTHMHKYIDIYMYIYICIYIRTYISTDTHTHILPREARSRRWWLMCGCVCACVNVCVSRGGSQTKQTQNTNRNVRAYVSNCDSTRVRVCTCICIEIHSSVRQTRKRHRHHHLAWWNQTLFPSTDKPCPVCARRRHRHRHHRRHRRHCDDCASGFASGCGSLGGSLSRDVSPARPSPSHDAFRALPSLSRDASRARLDVCGVNWYACLSTALAQLVCARAHVYVCRHTQGACFQLAAVAHCQCTRHEEWFCGFCLFILHAVLLQLSPPGLTWQHRQNTHCHIDMRHIILHRSLSTYIFYSKHEPSLILKDLFLVPTNGGIQLQGHMCAAGCLRACGGRRECRSARTGVL